MTSEIAQIAEAIGAGAPPEDQLRRIADALEAILAHMKANPPMPIYIHPQQMWPVPAAPQPYYVSYPQ